MTQYLVNATFTDDSHGPVTIYASSPKKALEQFMDSMGRFTLHIDSVSKVCEVEITQPEFHMENEFTFDDVDPSVENYEGQYVIRAVNSMRYIKHKKDRTARIQIVKAESGFGCDPTKLGSAVFVKDADGEDYRLERYGIMGVAKPEALEKWKKLYGEINF